MQPLVLCADVGGTQIKTGLLDASGRPASPIRRADARAAPRHRQSRASILLSARKAGAAATKKMAISTHITETSRAPV